ncbi:hypothetical protein J4218_01255 [Candidatus Pacearchaeota archaeon]|nr:hypothetical protein [Candidatus Pacearchaeota archaeon]
MEINLFKSNKNVFWEALLVTILIFVLGVIAGFVLENWRTSNIDYLYVNSELNLLDVKVQSEIYGIGDFDCNAAINENINFANRIYEEANTLEKYQKASMLTEDLIVSHKKYDLLRTLLLLNSIKIKKECNASYSNVVYFYRFRDKNPDIIAKESVFSKLLVQLKEKMGNEILLIPIGFDGNVSSVKLILDNYNISENELPVILINEKIKIKDVETVEDLMKYFD